MDFLVVPLAYNEIHAAFNLFVVGKAYHEHYAIIQAYFIENRIYWNANKRNFQIRYGQ